MSRKESHEIQTMNANTKGACRAFVDLQVVVLGLLGPTSTIFAQTASPPLSPTNIFAPVSTPANEILGLSIFVLAVSAVIFAVVFSLLVYVVVKFRSKSEDGQEPPQVYGSNQVELA